MLRAAPLISGGRMNRSRHGAVTPGDRRAGAGTLKQVPEMFRNGARHEEMADSPARALRGRRRGLHLTVRVTLPQAACWASHTDHRDLLVPPPPVGCC